jgi:orc1/cdc6 family replication initiation protein
MITDARVLQPDFVPKEVKHRWAEIDHLTDTLRPIATDDGFPGPSFLCGPSGAGKTCIARYTVDQLREEVVDLNTQYVNCWEDYSRFKTLYRLLEGLDKTVDIHRQSTPKDELLERLREYDGPHYVVILDEVDQLQDKGVLYDLYRMQNLTMILIANREEHVFSTLDERLNSRLQNCVRIRFNQYDISELVTILSDRVRKGFEPNTITDDQLSTIADYAAGDARTAVGILRNTARIAQQNDCEKISQEMIRKAVPEAQSEIRQKTTNKLTDHQQTLYELIQDAESIGGGTLYERYCETVTNPKTRRTMRNHLEKLEQYNLIIASGNTKARTYSPYT